MPEIMQQAVQTDTPSKFKILIMAARPKTLSVSAVPIIVGTLLALDKVKSMQWMLAFVALICAFAIQIGINLINDAIDFKKGADDEKRLGPKRVTQAGLLSYEQVLLYGLSFFLFALICGIPLILSAGWPLFWALLTSVIFGYLYTGGPFPLAYLGLGELFVLIFFGYVITCSAFYIQTGFIDSTCLLAATQLGLLAIIPIAINNARDIETDQKVNKKTLSVFFGLTFSRWEITLLTTSAYLLGLIWIVKGYYLMAILPFLATPLTYKNVQAIWLNPPSSLYNDYLARSAQNQLIFAGLLVIGYLSSIYFGWVGFV